MRFGSPERARTDPNGPPLSAVLLPADQPAGVPEDLLGEQDRSSGEGDGR